MDWAAFLANANVTDWITACAAAGTLIASLTVAAFTYRLKQIEESRQTPKLEITEAFEEGPGIRFVVVNRGHHATAVDTITLLQEGASIGGLRESEPGFDQQGKPAISPLDALLEPGRRVTIHISHFNPPLLANEGLSKRLRLKPVLGEEISGVVDANFIARKLRRWREEHTPDDSG